MRSLDQMLLLLVKALREPITRKATVSQFQSLVWEGRDPSVPEEAYSILADLAYDLDFFEADPTIRKQDSTYYGHNRLEQEIRTALHKLAEQGIEPPIDLSSEKC
jgi:hypothetical protein